MSLPAILTPESVSEILAAPDATTWLGRRDRLLLALMVRCGLRVSEALHLQTEHVIGWNVEAWEQVGALDLHLYHVKRTAGTGSIKRARDRVVPMPPDVAELLADWLTNDHGNKCAWVVRTNRHSRMDRVNAFRTVKKYADQCDAVATKQVPKRRDAAGNVIEWETVTRPAWPHSLRHTAATEMAESGLFELHEVAQVLGHASISTTGIYLHARPTRLADKMKEFNRGG